MRTSEPVVGRLENGETRFVRDIWGRFSAEGIRPNAIRYPREYNGSEYLDLACTQTNLSAKDQKALLCEWCEVLPTLNSVRVLWLSSSVSSDLFEAACGIANLEGLHLKWNTLKDIRSLIGCPELKYLHLGRSGSLVDIHPVESLNKLTWFQVEGLSKAFDLEPFEVMKNLIGLGFVGQEGKKLSVSSLKPLAKSFSLRWLNLGAVHVADSSLEPLSDLVGLEWLGLGNFFSMESFARLSSKLVNTKCEWLEPFARFHPTVFPCRKCGQNWKVMTSGSPSRLICPTCDPAKLAAQIDKFETARSKSS